MAEDKQQVVSKVSISIPIVFSFAVYRKTEGSTASSDKTVSIEGEDYNLQTTDDMSETGGSGSDNVSNVH